MNTSNTVDPASRSSDWTKPFTIMKIRNILLALLLLASGLTACKSSRQTPETVAENFLKAYLNSDFTGAAQYCHEQTADFLSDCQKEWEVLPEEIQAEMLRQATAIQPTLLNVKEHGRDSVLIDFCLRIDSLHHADGQMVLTRNEAKEWRIQGW